MVITQTLLGSIIHKNGEKYVGEIQNYKYHGKGTYFMQMEMYI